jgi:hypothetical protein
VAVAAEKKVPAQLVAPYSADQQSDNEIDLGIADRMVEA